MKNREYFKAVVMQKELRPKAVIKKIGLFKTEKVIVESYYLKCQIEGTNFIIVVPCEKVEYYQAKTNDRLSIHLEFKYEFSCFHFMPTKEKIKEINVS